MCDRELDEQLRRNRWASSDGFAKHPGIIQTDVETFTPELKFADGMKSMQYTPLLVSTCIALSLNPESAKEMHANFVAANLQPQLECFKLLIDTGIVERLPSGSVRVCALDALRMYVDALCRVGLPRRVWVQP